MGRAVGMVLLTLLVAALSFCWLSKAHAAVVTSPTSLCDATLCLLANRTTCNRQTQRCPPCVGFGRVPNEFTCVEFTANTTMCPQPTKACKGEAITSLIQGESPLKNNTTAKTTAAVKADTHTVASDKTVVSSPPSSVLAASNASPSPSPVATTNTTQPTTTDSDSGSDLAVILMVFGIIIGVLLLLIVAILIKRRCEKKQLKNRHVVAVAQVPLDYTDNSDDCKSPHALAYDSYSSSVDTIPMARNTMPRGAPPPPQFGAYVDGRKYAQPLNAPLRQHSTPPRHSDRRPPRRAPRRPPLTPPVELPVSPATARSESADDFETMLSVRSDWIGSSDAAVETQRAKPTLFKSSSSNIPILSHPARTESTDSHDDIDIYPDTNDSYLDTGSFHSEYSDGRMFSPISSRISPVSSRRLEFSPVSSRRLKFSPNSSSSRRQDSFFGIDL